MSFNVKNTKIFIGVDVSKTTLDVYRPGTNQAWQIENSEEAIAGFCTQLEKKGSSRNLVAGVQDVGFLRHGLLRPVSEKKTDARKA